MLSPLFARSLCPPIRTSQPSGQIRPTNIAAPDQHPYLDHHHITNVPATSNPPPPNHNGDDDSNNIHDNSSRNHARPPHRHLPPSPEIHQLRVRKRHPRHLKQTHRHTQTRSPKRPRLQNPPQPIPPLRNSHLAPNPHPRPKESQRTREGPQTRETRAFLRVSLHPDSLLAFAFAFEDNHRHVDGESSPSSPPEPSHPPRCTAS